MLSFNILTIFALLLYVSCGLASKKEANCSLARETAEIVSSCPRTNEEWEEAAARKNCENLTKACSNYIYPNYIYHCVINAWMNATVEVCAPSKFIVGRVCTEFSFGGNTIQRNENAKCQQCPSSYKSSASFRYPECYEYVKRSKETLSNKTPKTTEASILTTYFQSSSSSPSLTTTSNYSGDVQEENGSSHTKSKISIAIGVSVPTAALIVLLIFLVFRCNGRRQTSCGQAQHSVKRKLSSYCVPTLQTTSEADSLDDQNGSVDTRRITLTDETRLQPLIDHANM